MKLSTSWVSKSIGCLPPTLYFSHSKPNIQIAKSASPSFFLLRPTPAVEFDLQEVSKATSSSSSSTLHDTSSGSCRIFQHLSSLCHTPSLPSLLFQSAVSATPAKRIKRQIRTWEYFEYKQEAKLTHMAWKAAGDRVCWPESAKCRRALDAANPIKETHENSIRSLARRCSKKRQRGRRRRRRGRDAIETKSRPTDRRNERNSTTRRENLLGPQIHSFSSSPS